MRATGILRAGCLLASLICVTANARAHRDMGRETLHAEHGSVASGAGVTGGCAAVPQQVYVMANRSELIAALNNGVVSSTSPAIASNESKIIYANQPLTCADSYRNGYTPQALLAPYDLAIWGRDKSYACAVDDTVLVPLLAGPALW